MKSASTRRFEGNDSRGAWNLEQEVPSFWRTRETDEEVLDAEEDDDDDDLVVDSSDMTLVERNDFPQEQGTRHTNQELRQNINKPFKAKEGVCFTLSDFASLVEDSKKSLPGERSLPVIQAPKITDVDQTKLGKYFSFTKKRKTRPA